ncbi:MAG: hypothetical protein ACYCYK_10810, partial [Candidatus Dormibacteria bacterium]
MDNISGLSIAELEFQGPGYLINAPSGVTLTLAPSSSGGVSILDSGSTSGGENQISVPLTLLGSQEFQATGTDNLSITAPLAGSGNLATSASSSSVITLNAASPSYTGATTLVAGNLNVGSATALGVSSAPVTVAAGATLVITASGVTMANPLDLSGSLGGGAAGDVWAGAITLSGAGPDVSVIPGATFTLSGQVSGAVSQLLNLTGGSTVSTNGSPLPCTTSTVIDLTAPADAFTGGAFVSCGTVEIHGPGALGTSSVRVSQGTTLELVNGGTGYTVANPVSLGTTAQGQTAGAVIEDLSGNDTWSGPINVCPGPPTSGIAAHTGTFLLSGAVTLADSAAVCVGGSGASTQVAPSSASISGAVELGGPVAFSLGGTSTGASSQLVVESGGALP